MIYLDHNATTPLDPHVKREIENCFNIFGNPSSTHFFGKQAKEKIELARRSVADLIGCKPDEVIFTSCGTESNNMVLKGIVDLKEPEKNHIIISAVEHPSVLNPAFYLMKLGVKLTVLKVDRYGIVDPDDVRKQIRKETKLISIMLANNETGTIEPVEEIGKIGKEYGIPVHTDASQAVGKIPVDVNRLNVDLLTIAGHKLYAPKGIGALYVRGGIRLEPLLHGGGQEGGLRSGTENVIFSSAFGVACSVAKRRLKEDMENMKRMRDRLQEILFSEIDDLVLNGHPEKRLPNTLNVSVPGIPGEEVLRGIPEVIASTGSACHEGKNTISHVLSAMGVEEKVAIGALRFSTGRTNSMEQIERAAELIISQIKKLRRK